MSLVSILLQAAGGQQEFFDERHVLILQPGHPLRNRFNCHSAPPFTILNIYFNFIKVNIKFIFSQTP